MNYSFKGFKRDDGSVGTRNYVGIVSSVICSSTVVREISEKVPDSIPIVHANGCAQLGDDFELTRNMLVGVSSNPNINSTLLVGLGCETNQVDGLLELIPKTKPIKGIGIQQLSGGTNTVEKGVAIAENWANEKESLKRTESPLSGLNVGILKVDTDKELLSKSVPVIGDLVDKLIENQARVVMGVSKTLEPVEEMLKERIISDDKSEISMKLNKGLKRLSWKSSSQIAEKTELSEINKELAVLELKMNGSKPIKNILSYGEKPKESGLYLMNVSSNVVESLSKMAASGCNIALILSEKGVLTGSIALPCMTITTKNDSVLFDEIVDYTLNNDAPEKESESIINELLQICSGKRTKLEELELGEFSIPHLGTTY